MAVQAIGAVFAAQTENWLAGEIVMPVGDTLGCTGNINSRYARVVAPHMP